MTIAIGTSGFIYAHWGDGVFYPKGLPQSKWLEHYCQFFDTVELNVTFYRLPSESAFKSWEKRTPKNFVFALKGSRFITHVKRLKDAKEPLKIFFDQGAPLKSKTKVVLWQTPPQMKCNMGRLKNFVLGLKKYKKVLHAFEFRHESWADEKIFSLLAENGMSMCHADWPEFSKNLPDGFPFIYIRRHGPGGGSLYGSCYSDAQLKEDAKKIRRWAKMKKDVFVYFNNDAGGFAVKNALHLKGLLVTTSK
jgi:uncharacterized protein YecE (DUF72 family)